MFKAHAICLLTIIVILHNACSDAFLSQNNKPAQSLNDTLFLEKYQTAGKYLVNIKETINTDFIVVSKPGWFAIQNTYGTVIEGKFSLYFTITQGSIAIDPHIEYGVVALEIKDLGLVSFTVAYRNFIPYEFYCSPIQLVFDSTNVCILHTGNSGEAAVDWSLADKPAWLIFSDTSGTLGPGKSKDISVTIAGQYAGRTTDLWASFSISIDNGNGSWGLSAVAPKKAIPGFEQVKIEGAVKDAGFCKTTGIMAICTRDPSALLLYNTGTREMHKVPLPHTPFCLSISEDGTKVAVGYSEKFIGYFDVETMEMINELPVDHSPGAVMLGMNDWCYFNQQGVTDTPPKSLNLISGEYVPGGSPEYTGKNTAFIRVPGNQYILMKNTGSAFLIDISQGGATGPVDELNIFTEKYWLDEAEFKVITDDRIIYSLEIHPDQVPVVNLNYYNFISTSLPLITAFDECNETHSYFVTSADEYNLFSYPIEQFNSITHSFIRSMSISPILANDGLYTNMYLANTRFMFVNSQGTILYALKSLKNNSGIEAWAIEPFSLNGQ